MKKTDQQLANTIARKAGFGLATRITYDLTKGDCVIDRIRPGYRKISTNQYVPNAYRRRFGWKNTYYQPAITVVNLAKTKE
jgi:Rod binding domain-containing protein